MPKPDRDADGDAPEPSGACTPDPHRQTINRADYQQRLDHVTELFSSMMETASELSTRRCPYKNRRDKCTAAFGCRNQRKPEVDGNPMSCAGDDALDYRSSWETS